MKLRSRATNYLVAVLSATAVLGAGCGAYKILSVPGQFVETMRYLDEKDHNLHDLRQNYNLTTKAIIALAAESKVDTSALARSLSSLHTQISALNQPAVIERIAPVLPGFAENIGQLSHFVQEVHGAVLARETDTAAYNALVTKLQSRRKIIEDLLNGMHEARENQTASIVKALEKRRMFGALIVAVLCFCIAGGSAIGLRALNRRRSAIKEYEARLTELEARELKIKEAQMIKAGFVSAVSHELRTPLQTIVGCVDVILDGASTGRNRRFVDSLYVAINQLDMQIKDITDFEKLESGKVLLQPEVFNPSEILSRQIRNFHFMAGQKGLRIAKQFSLDDEFVSTDLTRFQQITSSLIKNAIKHTDKGVIRINYFLVELADTTWLRFTVEDQGPGIDAKEHQRLFDPFTQVDQTRNRAKEGAGMGLAITKRVVELMGGTITLESEVNVGSIFEVRLPVTVHAHAVDEGSAPATASLRTRADDFRPLS